MQHKPNSPLAELQKKYQAIEVPDELEFVVKKTIKQTQRSIIMEKRKKNLKKIATGTAASLIAFTSLVNFSPAFAASMSQIPLISSVANVLTLRTASIEKDGLSLQLETPVIESTVYPELAEKLNANYLEESQKLYQDFMADMGAIIEAGGHYGVNSGFEILTDTEEILSIGRYVVNTVGSSSTTMTYDTVDQVNGLLITLPSLFKDDQYMEVISNYLTETMQEEMAQNEEKVYWIADEDNGFKGIDANQAFYINSDNKLVISFDKYEIAPGYMGLVTFEIPTEIIKEHLVGTYIR